MLTADDCSLPSAEDEFLPVGTAVERVTGRRPHPTTCTRWTRHGVGGIKLQVKMIGGRPMTTEAFVGKFIDARTEAAGLS